MIKGKSLKIDAILWIVLMFLASVVAFNLLQRDKQRQFGSIAYGGFPQFHLKTIEGKDFDYLRFKRTVWAVHQGSGKNMERVASDLGFIAQSTASGKRHLNILTFVPTQYTLTRPVQKFQYVLQGSKEELSQVLGKLRMIKEEIVLLIDQDGAIRGRYDFTSPDDFRSFRQDLLRIL
jgi:hypothetical protein